MRGWFSTARDFRSAILGAVWFFAFLSRQHVSISANSASIRNLITIGIEAHLSVMTDAAFDSDFWPGGVAHVSCVTKNTRFLVPFPRQRDVAWGVMVACWTFGIIVSLRVAGVERIFLTLYCIEACIRLTAGGWSTFKDLWFLLLGCTMLRCHLRCRLFSLAIGIGQEWEGFHPRRLDLVLILVGLLALLVIPVLAAETSVSFEKLLVVRGLRLLRLVRALRLGALWGLESKRWWCKMCWFKKCSHALRILQGNSASASV